MCVTMCPLSYSAVKEGTLFYVEERELPGKRTRHESQKEAGCKSSDHGDEREQ